MSQSLSFGLAQLLCLLTLIPLNEAFISKPQQGRNTNRRLFASTISSITTITLKKKKDSELTKWLEQEHDANLAAYVDVDKATGLRGLRFGIAERTKDRNKRQGILAAQLKRSCILVSDNQVVHSILGKELAILEQKSQKLEQLSLRVLAELSCRTSKFSPYLESLPSLSQDEEKMHLGASWSEAQLQRLNYKPTIKFFQQERARRQTFVNNVLEGSAPLEISESLAAYAYDMVHSRALQGKFGHGGAMRIWCMSWVVSVLYSVLVAFGAMAAGTGTVPLEAAFPPFLVAIGLATTASRDELAMVPFFDIANHASHQNPSKYSVTVRSVDELPPVFEYNVFSDALGLRIFPQTNVYYYKEAHSAVETCDENEISFWLTYNYGGASGLSNDELLCHYGFVEEDNPNDTLILKCPRDGNNGSVKLCIGRYGKLHSLKEKEKLPPTNLIATEARNARFNLSEPPSERDMEDSEDILRAGLAKQWRQAKIRILDEFLAGTIE